MLSDPQLEPTLEEMTLKALEILKKNENGFVLLVEGGRIDTAHHETSAKLALEETREFQKAVQSARDMTNEEDSLIVVTADHSTALSAAGFMVSFIFKFIKFSNMLSKASRLQHLGTGRLLKI